MHFIDILINYAERLVFCLDIHFVFKVPLHNPVCLQYMLLVFNLNHEGKF